MNSKEKLALNVSLVHFFLMFGYKLFSLYFPLFLVEKGLQIFQIGYTNFLIYLPIALFAPLAGFLNHRINPGVLASLGILGYGIYSLGMIFFPNLFIFYLLQIILGVSASLFFVSLRSLLMGYHLKKPDKSFAWFYSAPSYADAFAPAVGALCIWKFGFSGVFAFSVFIQALTAVFCFVKLKKPAQSLTEKTEVEESVGNYAQVLNDIKKKRTGRFVFLSFLILILAGFNNAFFVLFLKNIGWSQNQILVFSSLISMAFLPISFFTAFWLDKRKSTANILKGSRIAGTFSIILGLAANVLNFYSMFVIVLFKNIGGLITNSGRSGLLSTKLKKYPEESAAVDTVFSPLAASLGALAGGGLITLLGYPLIFTLGGILVLLFGFDLKNRA
ncbi:MAG: MFS transporter [Candidatus Paceibacterota bacterium]|jgi:MFS family permease